jgi:hypothetical protein
MVSSLVDKEACKIYEYWWCSWWRPWHICLRSMHACVGVPTYYNIKIKFGTSTKPQSLGLKWHDDGPLLDHHSKEHYLCGFLPLAAGHSCLVYYSPPVTSSMWKWWCGQLFGTPPIMDDDDPCMHVYMHACSEMDVAIGWLLLMLRLIWHTKPLS